MIADVPIFPLSTVLFPGGVLPLRRGSRLAVVGPTATSATAP